MVEKTVPVAQNETSVASREVTRNPEYYVNPLVDIYESGEGLTVVADLPGVAKEGLAIKVENNILTIEGKMTHNFQPSPAVREYEPVHFYRQFELSDVVDQKRISAELKHGVLKMLLPKEEKAKPRQIEVKVS